MLSLLSFDFEWDASQLYSCSFVQFSYGFDLFHENISYIFILPIIIKETNE